MQIEQNTICVQPFLLRWPFIAKANQVEQKSNSNSNTQTHTRIHTLHLKQIFILVI